MTTNTPTFTPIPPVPMKLDRAATKRVAQRYSRFVQYLKAAALMRKVPPSNDLLLHTPAATSLGLTWTGGVNMTDEKRERLLEQCARAHDGAQRSGSPSPHCSVARDNGGSASLYTQATAATLVRVSAAEMLNVRPRPSVESFNRFLATFWGALRSIGIHHPHQTPMTLPPDASLADIYAASPGRGHVEMLLRRAVPLLLDDLGVQPLPEYKVPSLALPDRGVWMDSLLACQMRLDEGTDRERTVPALYWLICVHLQGFYGGMSDKPPLVCVGMRSLLPTVESMVPYLSWRAIVGRFLRMVRNDMPDAEPNVPPHIDPFSYNFVMGNFRSDEHSRFYIGFLEMMLGCDRSLFRASDGHPMTTSFHLLDNFHTLVYAYHCDEVLVPRFDTPPRPYANHRHSEFAGVSKDYFYGPIMDWLVRR